VTAVAELTWQQEVARKLVAAGVEVIAWVPDKRLSPIAAAIAGDIPVRTLTSEEACIGYAAGFRAAGGMPAVLCQCSGIGNSLNALGSLALPYGLGFPLVLSMRGTLGERNPAQVPLGRTTVDVLSLLAVPSYSIHRPADIGPVVDGVMALADGARQVAAIILEPELEIQ
jgi:sulfopyruvate decarboxylase alpha subunit